MKMPVAFQRFLSKIRILLRYFVPTSLFGRSLMIIITPVLLFQIISTYVFFDRHWSKMTSRLSQSVAGEIALMAEQFEHKTYSTDTSETIARAARKLDLLVTFEAGKNLDNNAVEIDTAFSEKLVESIQERVNKPFGIRTHVPNEWFEISVQLDNGILRVMVPEKRLFSSTAYVFLLWMIGTSAILFTIAILFMRNQIRPIKRLATAAERFGRGLEVSKFKITGSREVRQAAKAFENMRERIARQIEQRTTMLAGVSHDLRTPLTRIKLELEMLDNQDGLYDSIKQDIRDMERMIDGYLDFARGEEGERSSSVNLVQMVDRIVQNLRKQNVNVELSADTPIEITLRKGAFQRCLDNIFSNAKKYGDSIWVKLYMTRENIVEIVIEDNGPGIPEDKMEDAFKPFFRIDESRNTDTGGVGLGLAIARDIVHSHGGNIHLEKSNRGGLRVIIALPKTAPPSS